MISTPNSNLKLTTSKMNLNLFRHVLFLLVAFWPGYVTQVSGAEPHIVVDADSGAVLAANKADHQWYPASLTKLMTTYVTLRAIKNQELEDGSPVVMSKKAARQPRSKMGYPAGTRLRVDTALKIIIVKSANDVSIALAEAVAGSEKNFVARMNAEAKRLGMANTQFVNPNGLHNRQQYTSARDMARLAMAIRSEFPQYMNWFSAVAIKTGEKLHYSYNLLLERFSGADGMKTGFVCASGYNMVATAERNGKSLIAVVLGRASQTERAVDAAKLLIQGFETVQAGQAVSANIGSGDKPKNMRSRLCTEKARAARYDPAGGQAVIKSEYLHPKRISANILQVSTGGIDAPPGAAYFTSAAGSPDQIPVPEKSPGYQSVRIAEVGWKPKLEVIDGIPVPAPRPR